MTAAADPAFNDRMSEQQDANATDTDLWPLPSPDVLRELDPPAVDWLETEPVSRWPLRPPARG